MEESCRMNIRFIKSSQKKQILSQLNEQFGISELPYLLFETGKEKIRGFSGSLSKEEIMEISELTHIEFIGLYLINQEHDLRLSLDATQILNSQFSKNVLEITDEQYQEWIRGRDLPIKTERGTFIIKYKNDFIGCGKSNTEKVINHIPKERRLRK